MKRHKLSATQILHLSTCAYLLQEVPSLPHGQRSCLIRHDTWLWLIKMGHLETQSDYYFINSAVGRQDLLMFWSYGGNIIKRPSVERSGGDGDRLLRLDLDKGLLGGCARPGLEEQEGIAPGSWGQTCCRPARQAACAGVGRAAVSPSSPDTEALWLLAPPRSLHRGHSFLLSVAT